MSDESIQLNLAHYGPINSAPTNDVLHSWLVHQQGGVQIQVQATHLEVTENGDLVFTNKTRPGRPVTWALSAGQWLSLALQ